MAAVLAVSGAISIWPEDARACGCFAPPDPSKPVVQTGERIVFAIKDGKVTAHIQIQYQGSAEEFAWLVPLPGVPEVKVGTEELFAQIDTATQPSFLVRQSFGSCGGGGGGGFSCADASYAPRSGDAAPREPPPVAIAVSSAGPYDYAVLDASSKQPMLDWLTANHYFIPAGTPDSIDPYIHAGAYFLALKLRAGETTGDLQPVVLSYDSQYPMIPIVLTAVAANPDMGIQVWVLGDARAIPRNYQHVLINDELVDWVGQAANYAEVVGRAIDESQDHHAWVTEFAGSTSVLRGVLNAPERFGSRHAFETTPEASTYLVSLRRHDFPWAQLVPILRKYFSYPAQAGVDGFSADAYYQQIDGLISHYDGDAMFDAPMLTAEIWDRVVTPTLEAAKLFDENTKMTRLLTILSPEEMTADPVFAFNPDLPDVTNAHAATMTNTCDGSDRPWEMRLADGRTFRLGAPSDWSVHVSERIGRAPSTERVEVLHEEGQPQVVVDHSVALMSEAVAQSAQAQGGGGCTAGGRRPRSSAIDALFLAMLLAIGRRAMRWSSIRA